MISGASLTIFGVMRKPSITAGLRSSREITVFRTRRTILHSAYFICVGSTFLPLTVAVSLCPATRFEEVLQVVLTVPSVGIAEAVPTAAKARQARAPARN